MVSTRSLPVCATILLCDYEDQHESTIINNKKWHSKFFRFKDSIFGKAIIKDIVISVAVSVNGKEMQTESHSVDSSIQTYYKCIVDHVIGYFELRIQGRNLAE